MVKDNSDLWALIDEILRRLIRVENGSPLESAAVYGGRVRMMNDSELLVEGLLTVIGRLLLQGDMEVTGGGQITVGGVVITPLGGGRIQVGTGVAQIIIDSAAQRITIGDDIVLDAVNGEITVGDPGAEAPIKISAGTDGLAQVNFGDAIIRGGEAGVQMVAGLGTEQAKALLVTPGAIRAQGLPIVPTGSPGYWIGADLDGTLRRYPAGSGGPMGGDFDWPFDLSLVTSEFGMRTHPVTGEESMHYGIDFGAPAEADIPAASSGTVLAAGYDESRGNYVVLSHPNGLDTHYFHMQSTPAVTTGQTVAKGQTLGQVGSTGLSTAAHLHFEVHVNGVAINPRDFDGLSS